MSPGTIRAVVVDDHTLIVDLMKVVGPNVAIQVVAWAATAAEGVAAILAEAPDVAVVDYALPDASGADVIASARRHGSPTRFLMISGSHPARAVVHAMSAGFDGFIDKTRGIDEVLQAVTSVARGERLFPSSWFDRLPQLDDLEVHYQPVVDLATDGVVGAEALVRWRHPTQGLLAPAAFLPHCAATGLIVPLGWHVLRQACEAAVAWHRGGREDLRVAVNLSVQQLRDSHATREISDALSAAGLRPERLTLEITETEAVEEDLRDVLLDIERLGVRLAIDDFGTGHASLANLRRLPIRTLKIDRQFVSAVTESDQDAEIVASTVALAAKLGLVAIAEGVERTDQRRRLVELGCPFGQGYLWAPPLPEQDFVDRFVART